jgi:hypothetical protein
LTVDMKKLQHAAIGKGKFLANARARTTDLLITSQVLCH